MRICGGSLIDRDACKGMITTGNLKCSRHEGVDAGLVCDADIYGVERPAEYLKKYLEGNSTSHEVIQAVRRIHKEVKGGYACAWKCGKTIYIFRDPVGLKPLYHYGNSFSSERKAFSSPHVLLPGELVQLPGITLMCNRIKAIPTTNPEAIQHALTESVYYSIEKNAVILFSGGIDSSILAFLADAPLVVCGLEDSHDIIFARKAAKLLHRECTELILSEKNIRDIIPEVLSLIDEKTFMNLEIGVLMYHLCKNQDADIFISGQGADELFGGYKKYEIAFHKGEDVKSIMRKDLDEISCGLERDRHIAEQFNKRIRYPYCDLPVVEKALGVPDSSLFTPQRKEFLRRVARLLNLPDEIVSRPKKALQYGSGIHKTLKKMDIHV
jgi:asparagine synthase (glutamine-hydrolysing)